jgi:monofunctional biosynthetic peptidoglycan transglycosylase
MVEQFVEAADQYNVELWAGGLDALDALSEDERCDVVINASASSLQGEVPPVPEHLLGEGVLAYDMMYGAQPTVFLAYAAKCGARTAARHAGRTGRRGVLQLARRAAQHRAGAGRAARGAAGRSRPLRRRPRGPQPPDRRIVGQARRIRCAGWPIWRLPDRWRGGDAGLFLPADRCLAGLNPSSTTFMRAERWRLCGFNFWSCRSRQWVRYDEISRNIKRAVIASEDADFVNHPGYELDAMLDAWERNKQRGRIVRGGSTITQQLAKNLFLSSEQNYLRKGQELAITWMLELWLDKQRIFEIYLNSVEWGEGVFGVEAAAQHYFHTSASKLTVGQAARLAARCRRPSASTRSSTAPTCT